MPTVDVVADEGTQVDRRRHERVPVALDATLTRVGGRGYVEPVQTVDLSEGGAGILATETFNVGDVVVLSVGSQGMSVDYQGLVVGRRGQDDGQLLNLAFKTLPAEAVKALERLLAATADQGRG
jgi:hypothetical protein